MSDKKGFWGRLFQRGDTDPDTDHENVPGTADAAEAGQDEVPTEEELVLEESLRAVLEPSTSEEEEQLPSEAYEVEIEDVEPDPFADDNAAERPDATTESRPVSEQPAPTETRPPAPVVPDIATDAAPAPFPEPVSPRPAEPEAAPEPEPDQSAQPPEPAVPAPEGEGVEETAPKRVGFFGRLTKGLSKSSAKLTDGVSAIFTQRKLDDETLEELEDLLITADLGVTAATRITTELARDKFDKEISDEDVRKALALHVSTSLAPLEKEISINPEHKPHVILMTGVNGAGKTTTIGKLARKFADEGKSVMLAAGDTFRAAAIEQLSVWGERVGAKVIARDVGADAAGLAYDALQQARDENIDVLMIDTAGRLQNRRELMDELAKIVRVVRKLDSFAPHDTVLVLDATVGQNAISQAEAFMEIAGVSGLIMTKLDGTARGGVLVALADKFSLPVHYVGVGESVEDLQPFNAHNFTRALTGIDTLTDRK